MGNPQRQQSGECGRGVAVAAGPHEVVHGEQHLAHLQVVLGESLRIVGQQDSLPHRGGRLFAGQVSGAVRHGQGGESGGDGPGTHQNWLLAVLTCSRKDVDQLVHLRHVDPAAGGRQ